MRDSRISIKEAVRFHGHLGPYLILGILAGELAFEALRYKRYFGLKVKVWGTEKKPKSCLLDGLQLSTGATYGKGNIRRMCGNEIKILFRNLKNSREIEMRLKEDVANKLKVLLGRKESDAYARALYKIHPRNIFRLKAKNMKRR